MKKIFYLLMMSLAVLSCSDLPIDEDNLLITSHSDCYVGSFELVGLDHRSVLNTVTVDTVAQEIRGEVFYGTDLTRVWPQFSLAVDCKLSPKITDWEDFSDLDHPKQYTVISGNRQVSKVYTIYLTIQKRN